MRTRQKAISMRRFVWMGLAGGLGVALFGAGLAAVPDKPNDGAAKSSTAAAKAEKAASAGRKTAGTPATKGGFGDSTLIFDLAAECPTNLGGFGMSGRSL